MSFTLSIYIPRMAASHDEESIRNIMANCRIGTVSHVDFTPINKKPGFGEKVDEVVKSAFVHFSDPIRLYYHEDKNYHSKIYRVNLDFWETVENGHPYKFQITPNEYWICLKNNNPVQRTMMNIHQVVENGRHLENLIEEQANKIQEQEETIEKISHKLECVHNIVYQLLGGLYNQKNQSGTLSANLNVLFNGSLSKDKKYENTGKWENWPTTRQGDENERRIESLEKTVRNMLSFDCPNALFTSQEDDEFQDSLLQMRKYQDRDDNSISSHSSMPDLEEVSVNSGERIRNSFELCGNE